MSFRTVAPAIALVTTALHASAQPELVERTLAIVGGQAITLSDVRAALALGLIDAPPTGDPIKPTTERLIERTLVLREVQRYAPPEPAVAAVDARVAALAARFPSAQARQTALAAVGFSDAQFWAWARDDLRIAAYIDQRFTAAGTPSDDDVTAYYVQHRDEYDRDGKSFEQAAPEIRQRLTSQHRAELVTDWIADLRRRTPIVELLKS